MNLQFYLRFSTQFGESLWISGNAEELGMGDPKRAVPMEYLNDEFWHIPVSIPKKNYPKEGIIYKYFFKNKEGQLISEWGLDRIAYSPNKEAVGMQLIDTWNHGGEIENAFFTAPFKKVLLRHNHNKVKFSKHHTHQFKVKAPLTGKHEVVCITGSGDFLGNWSEEKVILMVKEGDWWTAPIDLTDCFFPVAYKYGIFNKKDNCFIKFENGNNRILHADGSAQRITIIHDGFIRLTSTTWKGAGVSVPVFSLRSKKSFGVGEFTDLKLLADWAKETGIKLIQVLPVNDTIATHSRSDSYPYAAISAFALHPIYINLAEIAGKSFANKLDALKKKQAQLNDLTVVDYEEVIRFKMAMLKELYELMGTNCFESEEYKQFFEDNKHWLVPYAAFSYLRDKFGTSHFTEWPSNSVYIREEIDILVSHKSSGFKQISFYFFVQYHLHIQLKEAAEYAHKKGVVLKGDIPIGIYRYGCDAWMAPELYDMNMQAGAPPDDFTPIGQNWGFPTYNWKRMQEDGFTWWKKRFGQMSNYFDAFRIDHILGFFRIWSIPAHAVQGIMGHFVPSIPVHYIEFGENGIWFDEKRYCNPFINDEVVNEVFGRLTDLVKEQFIIPNDVGGYDLKPDYDTQQKVETYFAGLEQSDVNTRLKLGLFDLISNVLFFKQEGSRGQEFHFRISMEKTSSFRFLIPHVQEKLKLMYENYFYRRQDEFWKNEALQKLPYLKEATNMLICGEDLGMVPACVPEVMKQLGILSLEIQRMPKDSKKEFFNPEEAPYLSVITPSTHDMSTIRGWWEENKERTRRFYNQVMRQWGTVPQICESWINRAIVLQHLYSPAMWSIFQLQDLMGMSETLRRENPHEERINNPANSKNYWQYRMHIYLEELLKQDEFNEELKGYVVHSGR